MSKIKQIKTKLVAGKDMMKVLAIVGIFNFSLAFFGYEFLPTDTISVQSSTNPLLEDCIPKVIGSVVHVTNEIGHWQGSGFLVTPDIIVTARHVVEDGNDFTVTLNNGKQVKSYRALSNKKYDIGFLRLEKPITGFETRLGSIFDCRLGQQVFAIGSPFGKVNRNSVTLGIISRMNCDFKSFPYEISPEYGWPDVTFQTDANGEPGNSGCPVFTLDGVVRGILVGGFSNGIIFCLPADLFMNELQIVRLLFAQDKYDFEKRFVPKVVVTP